MTRSLDIVTLTGEEYDALIDGRRPKPLCPACGDHVLVPLRTLSVKICPTCSHEVAWNLEPGQKPVIEGGRCAK